MDKPREQNATQETFKNGPYRKAPHNKLHDPNGNGQDMSQGFATPDGTPTEAREAEVGQAPDGQTISTN